MKEKEICVNKRFHVHTSLSKSCKRRQILANPEKITQLRVAKDELFCKISSNMGADNDAIPYSLNVRGNQIGI